MERKSKHVIMVGIYWEWKKKCQGQQIILLYSSSFYKFLLLLQENCCIA